MERKANAPRRGGAIPQTHHRNMMCSAPLIWRIDTPQRSYNRHARFFGRREKGKGRKTPTNTAIRPTIPCVGFKWRRARGATKGDWRHEKEGRGATPHAWVDTLQYR
ncbi:hypothetical protein, unlikely [Trypanosoma congolense IL3000]|uniref:Uncharacterized protein n=1 Tax=Trypanosoma congolense (strain IL3000) TaxID=1068625 RepID=F9W9H8_TRYCI|nr:hypothetical protein, unlikely [Trypanosoma congolense IL3000]